MSSGLAGCTMAILPFVSAGDHLLVPDSVYGPTRRFCDLVLKRFGVETTYYEPSLGAEIETLIKANTRLVFTEAPGSLTFEMQDIPAITEVAHRHACVVLMDNTWATPLYFKALAHGVDVSIQAATKYISGHSDLVMGIATARTGIYTSDSRTRPCSWAKSPRPTTVIWLCAGCGACPRGCACSRKAR